MSDGRAVALTVGTVLLAAAISTVTAEIVWLAIAAGVVAVLLVAYAAGLVFGHREEEELEFEAVCGRGPDGTRVLKLKCNRGVRPDWWSATILSFSGEWRGRVRFDSPLAREQTWPPGEIVVLFPVDVPENGAPPRPGTFEVTWYRAVVGADGSIVEEPIAKAEFEYE